MGLLDEIGAIVNPFVGLQNPGLWNSGSSGSSGDAAGPGVNLGQFAGGGTYQEGTITNVNKYIEDLQNKLKAGDITQAQFISQVQPVIGPAVDFANQLANSGSAVATAVGAAGYSKLMDLQKDFNVYASAQELLGRDITPQEFAQFKPRFADNADTGRAYLAEFAQQEAKSPQALEKKAPQYAGQVNKTFQDLLARGATQEEADYFGRLLATGQVTPYEVNQFVQALPEYQTKQDTAFRGGLESELAQYDEKAFGRERENILSQYTKAGLQNSSALDFAITDALGKLQEQRGAFLGSLSAQQYGGNKDAARRDYESQRNRYFEGQDYSRGRGDAYLDYLTQRADQGADYTRQRNDYLQFLANQPRQQGPGVLDYVTAGAGLAGGIGQLAGGFGYLNR